MNYDELVDRIYDNAGIDGVACLQADGKLIESQLSISEDSVRVIADALIGMRQNLTGAYRDLKGLVFETENQRFISFFNDTVLLLIEVQKSAPVNETFEAIRSLFGDGVTAEAYSVESPAVQQDVSQANQVFEEEIEDGLPREECEKVLLGDLKRVASAQLAKKIVAEASHVFGIPDEQTVLSREQFASIAREASERIPNPARRRMLQKELKTQLAKHFDIQL